MQAARRELFSGTQAVPVVDLFAGPGGLGEGFSSLVIRGHHPFRIVLSVESDEYAYNTLCLRTFLRQFGSSDVPEEYYSYLRGDITAKQLFSKYRSEHTNAKKLVWRTQLGATQERTVDKRITRAIGQDKVWVLIGGPPCQAYSLAGRSKLKSLENFDFDKDERHFLYKEYLRIVARHRPVLFLMENVKGILSSKVNGEEIFQRILADLAEPVNASKLSASQVSYSIMPLIAPNENQFTRRHSHYVVRSEDFGIPQARHRVFLLGIRKDFKIKLRSLKTIVDRRVTAHDVIGELPSIRSRLSVDDTSSSWLQAVISIKDERWLNNGSLRPKLRKEILGNLPTLEDEMDSGAAFLQWTKKPKEFIDWLYDPKLGGITGHESRSHMQSDLHRYFYAASFSKIEGRSPKLPDFPRELLPDHRNVRKAGKDMVFSDRFRVQLAHLPATTITSHMAKDGHYYIHFDPRQCRSLTVREAARIQTFPDSYFFEGPRTKQYQQIGNAVPPLLARQIALLVSEYISDIDEQL